MRPNTPATFGHKLGVVSVICRFCGNYRLLATIRVCLLIVKRELCPPKHFLCGIFQYPTHFVIRKSCLIIFIKQPYPLLRCFNNLPVTYFILLNFPSRQHLFSYINKEEKYTGEHTFFAFVGLERNVQISIDQYPVIVAVQFYQHFLSRKGFTCFIDFVQYFNKSLRHHLRQCQAQGFSDYICFADQL